jgi:hypothetical protein
MSLERRNTRFGLPPSREATPDSDDESNDTTSLLAASDNYSLNNSSKLRKKSWASRDDGARLKMPRLSRDRGEEARTSLKPLHIPQAVQHKVRAVGNVRMKHSSPWESLTRNFSLMLNDSVMIASQKDGRFVAVREFSGLDADRKVNMLQRIREGNGIRDENRIRDENFIAFLDCFSFEGSCYVVFEHETDYREHGITYWEKFPVTLTQYALIAPYPTEQQLATILGQVSPPWGVRAHPNMKSRLSMVLNTSPRWT